jgi:hypothetical protein
MVRGCRWEPRCLLNRSGPVPHDGVRERRTSAKVMNWPSFFTLAAALGTGSRPFGRRRQARSPFPAQERRPYQVAQWFWCLVQRGLGRRAGSFRLRHVGRRTLHCFLGGRACRAPRKVLGRQIPRFGVHHFARGAVQGNTLVTLEHRLAVQRRHFPAAEHTERVRMRPAHLGGDLVARVDGKRPNVFIMNGKRQRPFLPQLSELLAVLSDGAISLNTIRRHVRFHVDGKDITLT